MPVRAVQNEVTINLGEIRNTEYSSEVVACCPQCKAFQTVWINGGTMMPTRKFWQGGSQIFHDCGSSQPCRLYV